MSTRPLHTLAMGLGLALALVGSARASDAKAAPGSEGELPQTAEESLTMAKQYEDRAAMWRDEAAHHRQMAIDYKRFSKSPMNPTIAEMAKHCGAIVREANKLAAESDALAEDYRQRAKELEHK